MAIRSSVTVSLVPEARGGPFVFWDDLSGACAKARTLGFDAVEVFLPSAEAVDPAVLRGLLDEHGLALAAVGTGAGWVKGRLHLSLPEASDRARARAFVRSIIDFAAPYGAPAIIGSMQGRTGPGVDHDQATGWLCDVLEDLGEHARSLGVPLLYEFLNRYETDLANTVAAALALLNRLSTKNVALLADLFHMNIEEADTPGALRAGGPRIGHVHFVDSNRRAAGFGHTDFALIADALRDVGYSGFASAEALPWPDPDGAARRTIDAFRRHFPNAD